MFSLRRSWTPSVSVASLALLALLSLATVAAVRIEDDQTAAAAVMMMEVGEGFDAATHPPAWNKEPATLDDPHKYWQAALTIEVPRVVKIIKRDGAAAAAAAAAATDSPPIVGVKRARSPSPSPSASRRSSVASMSDSVRAPVKEGPPATKRARYESAAPSAQTNPRVSLAAGGPVAPQPRPATSRTSQRLAEMKRKEAAAKRKSEVARRDTRVPATARQTRAGQRLQKPKSLLSVDSSAQSTVSLGIYPPAPLVMPLNGPRKFVRDAQLKQNPSLPVAKQVGKSKRWMIGSFMYTLDAHDRVTNAAGAVSLASAKRPALAGAVDQFCDAMYNPKGPFTNAAGVPIRPRKAWQSGHVIAYNLGGSNTEPLNFYPQHYQSNSGGGKWWRIELIAGAVRAWIEAATTVAATCPVQLQVEFDYNHGTKVVPYASGGSYTIGVSAACFKPIASALKLGAVKKYGGLNSYARAFAKNAKIVGTQYELSVDWLNAPDKATATNAPQLFAP